MIRLVLLGLLIASILLVARAILRRGSGQAVQRNTQPLVLAAQKITEGYTPAMQALAFAGSQTNCTASDSPFLMEAKKEFRDHYGPWLQANLTPQETDTAVFKMVMYGYGFMGYLQPAQLADPQLVLATFDRVLKRYEPDGIETAYIERTQQTLQQIEDDAARTNAIVNELKRLAGERGRQLLWLSEKGEGLLFFIVADDAVDALLKVEFDADHQWCNDPPIS